MTKVKFEAATGAELRQQMLDFLGLGTANITGSDLRIVLDRTKSQFQSPVAPVGAPTEEKLVDTQVGAEAMDNQVAEKTKTRTRRSKAEIEAEKAEQANGPADDTSTGETLSQDNAAPEEAPAKEEVVVKEEGPKVTKESLTPLVLNLGRAGRKAEVVALLSKFTQADGTTPVAGLPTLQPSDYQAFHDEIVKL